MDYRITERQQALKKEFEGLRFNFVSTSHLKDLILAR